MFFRLSYVLYVRSSFGHFGGEIAPIPSPPVDPSMVDKELDEIVGKAGRMNSAIKNSFLCTMDILNYVKTEVIDKVVRQTNMYSSALRTLLTKHKARINPMKIKFVMKINNNARRDRIRKGQ